MTLDEILKEIKKAEKIVIFTLESTDPVSDHFP